MTGTTRSSVDLDVRRRKALYHSWHRGIREMDLVLGQFADAHIGDLSDDEMTDYEALMEVPDRDLFKWMTGEEPIPENYDTGVFTRVRAFHGAGKDLGAGAESSR